MIVSPAERTYMVNMLRALVLALLVALLPASTAAHGLACHGGPAEMSAADHRSAEQDSHTAGHHGRQGDAVAGEHNCVGCIPPAHGVAAIARHSPVPDMAPTAHLLRALCSTLPKPDTPPPRMLD